MTAPECVGRVYGCRHCGKNEMTIHESFAHDCPQRPRPTLTDIAAALLEVRPKYLADAVTVRVQDGQIRLHIDPTAAARFEGARRRYGTAQNRIGEPLLKRGFRLAHGAGTTKVY